MQNQTNGFTLVEMAIVLVVISLLLGGLLMPLSTQIENSRRHETEKVLESLKEGLIGFALVNGRLPCPDKSTAAGPGIANDGQQDIDTAKGECAVLEGNLPWVDLGTAGQDSWGTYFRYRVDGRFADMKDGSGCGVATAGVSFELCSVGNLAIVAESGGANVATNIPAVILSHAKNGLNAVSGNESENTDADATFVSRVYSDNADPVTNPQGVYDDIVVWIAPNILFNRMVAAGRLP